MTVIEVTSAAELSKKQTAEIEKVFSAKHKGEKIDFVYKIDKELIGGILVVDGDKYYDGTYRSQIDKIGAAFSLSDKYVEAATATKRKRAKKPAVSAYQSGYRQRAFGQGGKV